MLNSVNWIAVLAAAVVNMVVGFLWYSKALFGKKWIQAAGISDSEMKGAGKAYIWSFVGAILMALVLSVFVGYGASDTWTGIQIGFWVWLGFIMPVGLSSVLFEKTKTTLFWINMGYYLAVLAINGAILANWM